MMPLSKQGENHVKYWTPKPFIKPHCDAKALNEEAAEILEEEKEEICKEEEK